MRNARNFTSVNEFLIDAYQVRRFQIDYVQKDNFNVIPPAFIALRLTIE